MQLEMGSLPDWLALVRERIAAAAPELGALYEVYAEEALFGRRYIDNELVNLAANARILEVGAGAMLLSCQLVREGWNVTALEPTGQGFGHFERLREIILEVAVERDCVPLVLDSTAETLSVRDRFDFAFSINVMEHVGDVECALAQVGASLRQGASYRFTCPNYLFPYEPHFNIPTLFSKNLTERFLFRRIHSRAGIADPAGLWRSLNWINVAGLRRMSRRLTGLELTFDKRLVTEAFERIGTDPCFASRRSSFVRKMAGWMVRARLHKAFGYVPAAMQPLIDCRVVRVVENG